MDEAGAGFRGPGMQPGEQTGVAACRGLLGRRQPEAKERFEILEEEVCVGCGGHD